MSVGLLYLFDVPTFSSSLINFNQTYASSYPRQVGRNIVIQEEEVWIFLRISYLMLPVEGRFPLLRYKPASIFVAGSLVWNMTLCP